MEVGDLTVDAGIASQVRPPGQSPLLPRPEPLNPGSARLEDARRARAFGLLGLIPFVRSA